MVVKGMIEPFASLRDDFGIVSTTIRLTEETERALSNNNTTKIGLWQALLNFYLIFTKEDNLL